MYNCNKCVSQLYIFFCRCTIGFAVVLFFAVVLISCMIPTYNFAVLPFFLQLYIWFRSYAIFFAVVLIYFCVEQNLLSDPIFIYFMTTLKHMASCVIILQRTLALLFSRHLVRLVVALPLIKSPPPICRCLSLRHCLTCLLSIRLVVASPCFSRRQLPSAGASASHRAVASCHAAPLGPLVTQ